MTKLFLIITLLFPLSAFAQTSFGLSFGTGDTEMEAHLNDVNGYGSENISFFRDDLAVRFGASKTDMDFFLVKERMRPADVYYGYVLSYTTRRPVYDVMKIYKKKKGWGSVAKELGIKPGSDEFHQLKNNTLTRIDKDKMKGNKNKSKKTLEPGNNGNSGNNKNNKNK